MGNNQGKRNKADSLKDSYSTDSDKVGQKGYQVYQVDTHNEQPKFESFDTDSDMSQTDEEQVLEPFSPEIFTMDLITNSDLFNPECRLCSDIKQRIFMTSCCSQVICKQCKSYINTCPFECGKPSMTSNQHTSIRVSPENRRRCENHRQRGQIVHHSTRQA